jgi:hypothetical protein
MAGTSSLESCGCIHAVGAHSRMDLLPGGGPSSGLAQLCLPLCLLYLGLYVHGYLECRGNESGVDPRRCREWIILFEG